MQFEWDDAKNESNCSKHGIRFEAAISIFNHIVLTRVDDRKDYGETRSISIGRMHEEAIVVVAHTDRDGCTRIISARRANRVERKRYHEYCEEKPE